MSKGYAGDWHISGPMLPTDTELDALAFGLLVPLLKARGVEGRFRTPELVPLKSFAGIAGKRRVPLRQAFEEALGTYEGMCKDGAEVPPGAQLSAAPVFACVSLRLELGMPVPGDDDPVTHPLYASPFKDFMDFIDYPIDQRVAGELQHGHDVATGLGFTLDPP